MAGLDESLHELMDHQFGASVISWRNREKRRRNHGDLQRPIWCGSTGDEICRAVPDLQGDHLVEADHVERSCLTFTSNSCLIECDIHKLPLGSRVLFKIGSSWRNGCLMR